MCNVDWYVNGGIRCVTWTGTLMAAFDVLRGPTQIPASMETVYSIDTNTYITYMSAKTDRVTTTQSSGVRWVQVVVNAAAWNSSDQRVRVAWETINAALLYTTQSIEQLLAYLSTEHNVLSTRWVPWRLCITFTNIVANNGWTLRHYSHVLCTQRLSTCSSYTRTTPTTHDIRATRDISVRRRERRRRQHWTLTKRRPTDRGPSNGLRNAENTTSTVQRALTREE